MVCEDKNMRIRNVETKKEFEKVVDEYITLGYKVIDRGEETAKMSDVQNGSIIVHAVLAVMFWWIFCIPNFVYIWHSRRNADEVLIKIDN